MPPREPLNCVSACQLDLTGDRSISIDDLFIFLSLWFSGDARADWNRSRRTEIDDLFLFLNDYFNNTRTHCVTD